MNFYEIYTFRRRRFPAHHHDHLVSFIFYRLQEVKDLNIKFVTNTTKECKSFLLERLERIGFNVCVSQVFTSLSAARKVIEAEKLRPFLLIDDRAMDDFDGLIHLNFCLCLKLLLNNN